MQKINYSTYKKPTDFARFEQGDTTIRIISSGGLKKEHGMKTGRGYVPLGDCTETPECKQCLSGNESKLKWIWIAYIRPTKEVKILSVGAMVGDGICKLAQEKGKDPQDFDIAINKTGTGRSTKYSVRATEGKPLTSDEQKLTTNTKKFLIKKYFDSSSDSTVEAGQP